MKRAIALGTLVFSVLLLLPAAGITRSIDPVVSTDWLAGNTQDPKIVMVDIRKVEDYKAGHVPGAVNIFYNTWAITEGKLRNQIPPVDDLIDIINSAGIAADSKVVIVGNSDTPLNRSGITRVAWTLEYAGIENVAILDGGWEKWAADKKPVATDITKPKTTNFQPKLNKNMPVAKDDVRAAIGREVIVDVRDPDFYEGKKKLDFVARAGRIKNAVNLPATAAYNPNGTFKSKKELADMAAKIVGDDLNKNTIVYCDTGRLASVWAYLLKDVLGYKNVRMYDGSSEEWMADPSAPIEP
ncbi:MAG: sulfurtransferase [Syntrophorhabdaceae bacterium]|nr:sulfurtransferase [Syntrophorhabdaceae bacterium]MDD4196105.1 sulfurtransferase [Syntrophorhabdaceae bacterium]HOC45028.1 sulfurtransferase [Syntrophorhabdaceae bacterium]